MIRRLLISLVTIALWVTAGCGTEAGEGENAVQVLLFGEPEELIAYRELVQDFEARSGLEVELVEASDRADLIARLSTSIAGGAAPDVFLLNYRYYGLFAANGSIAPMDEQLAASDELEANDFYPVAMDAFNWEGAQLCLPQNVSSLAVYYNRNLFQRYGVAEPPDGWTWSDMVRTAISLTRDANGNQMVGSEYDTTQVVDVYGLGVEPSVIRLAPFVWSNGEEIVDDPLRPTRFTLDRPAATAVMRGFLDLRRTFGVVPTDAEVEAEDHETRFANGKMAMLFSSRRATTTFRSITDFEWDVAPLPRYQQEAGILHSDAYCITSESPRQDQAWEFVEFALSETGQRALAKTGRTVPSNIEVSRSRAFLGTGLPPSRSRVFLDAIDVVRPVPTISTWPEIEDVTSTILEDAMYKGLTVEETVQRLDEETRDLFARGDTP